jgi:hypothetical protein
MVSLVSALRLFCLLEFVVVVVVVVIVLFMVLIKMYLFFILVQYEKKLLQLPQKNTEGSLRKLVLVPLGSGECELGDCICAIMQLLK